MGHYYADMMCNTCGNVRCTCPPETKKPNGKFIVTDDYRVVTVDEFDADPDNNIRRMRYGTTPVNPLLSRMGKKEFKLRRDAEVHAREMCEAAVERCHANLLEIKNILKVKRPWEKK